MRLPLLALLLSWPAAAQAPSAETFRWEVHYMGVVVGHAALEVQPSPEGERLSAEAHSAEWFRGVYAMDDRLRSQRRVGGGSRSYEASYREGDWHHDLSLQLGPEAVQAERRQREDAGWRSWADTYPGVAPEVEDPLSMFQRLRELPLSPGETLSIEVFDGRSQVSLQAEVQAPEPCPGALAERRCLPLALSVAGQRGKRVDLWLSDDAERLPARLSARTPGFSLKAELIEWSPHAP
ncbi:MAG: DUF3108 domain-containing protein [Alphaproteobacteria bacterium]|nr:DUF3108 domain-containing protein [Alphaproteobacteria bacterium]